MPTIDQEKILRYLDGDLTASERKDVEGLIRTSPEHSAFMREVLNLALQLREPAPHPELLTDYLDGTLAPKQAELLEDEIKNHPELRDALALLESMATGTEQEAPRAWVEQAKQYRLAAAQRASTGSHSLRPRKRRVVRAGTIAVAVAVLLFTGYLFIDQGMRSSHVRDEGDSARDAGMSTPESPEGAVSLNTESITIRWTPDMSAIQYRVQIVLTDGSPLFRVNTKEPWVSIPARDLPDGETLSWWVEVVLDDGRSYRTELTDFILRGSPR